MGFTVLVPQAIPGRAVTLLEEMGCRVKIGKGHTEADLAADIVDCDAVALRTAKFTRAVIEAGTRLKVLSRYGVGVDNIDIAAATERGIWVANTPESNSATVAEHTFAMLLACAIDLVEASNATKRGDFVYRDSINGVDVAGRTLGLVGFGRIGRHIARMAGLGFGMCILAYDPYVKREAVPEGVTVTDEWEAVFREADFLSLHLPLNDSTRGIVGGKEFGLMKKTAYFINCARGEVMRESDLVAALRNGEIAGAALDVFEKEPPERGNPLFGLKNVILTPHSGSCTGECLDRLGSDMVRNIREVMEGRKPCWPVNMLRIS